MKLLIIYSFMAPLILQTGIKQTHGLGTQVWPGIGAVQPGDWFMEKQQPRVDAECSLWGLTIWIQISALPPTDLCYRGNLTNSEPSPPNPYNGLIIHLSQVSMDIK